MSSTPPQRTTLILRPDLLAAARKATGIKRKTDLVHAGLAALIRQEAAEFLANLHGTAKGFSPAPRRKSTAVPSRSANRPASSASSRAARPASSPTPTRPTRSRRRAA